MNESKELESLSALAEATEAGKRRQVVAWVRVSPGPYLAVASVSAFLAALLLRSEYDLLALLLIGVGMFVIPILALRINVSTRLQSVDRVQSSFCLVPSRTT
jgi:hypothetical protein